MTPTTKVMVLGGTCHVSTSDLADSRRTYLPMYTKAGLKWEDTKAGQRAARNSEATTIHRLNIGAD